MATSLKLISGTVSTTSATKYTCPASTSAAVTGLYLCNTDVVGNYVTLVVYDVSKTTNFTLLSNLYIPAYSTLELPQDIYLEAGDLITAVMTGTTNTITIIGSVAEKV